MTGDAAGGADDPAGEGDAPGGRDNPTDEAGGPTGRGSSSTAAGAAETVPREQPPDLSGLFAPGRVALVGATDREGSVGRALLSNLLDSFEGEVVAVNPNRETALGLECYPDLGSVPDPVDLAVVAVPPEAAVSVVQEAGRVGVENVVVITAGFSETGAVGAARQRELVAAAAEHDLALVGPNSVGVAGTAVGLNATFAPTPPRPGTISFLSQSGAFVTAVLDWAADHGVGFRNLVSLGNEAVLDEVDFVAAWGDDPGTDVVVGYLEDIEDGRAFVDAARSVTAETPVVLLKAGRTEAGARAAASHTGAMAGSDRAAEAGLRQAGVLRADTVQELFDVAQALAGLPLPATDGVAVVTNAGGPGVVATDAVGDSRLSLADLAPETRAALADALPETASVTNPVDVVGDADIGRFRAALDAVLDDPNVASAVVVSSPTAVLDYDDLADAVADVQADYGTPVAAALMGGERAASAGRRLADRGIPNYFDPARAVDSLAALADYRDVRDREYAEPATFDVDRERARAVLARVEDRADNRLGVEAMDLLAAYGIPTPVGTVVDDPADAEAAARDLGGPVVMKLVSPDILHKSDVGGVAVGVAVEDVRETYEALVARARRHHAGARVLGVQVQEEVDVEAGEETIVGVSRDPQFGPLVAFGLGGIFVEILEDVAFRLAPPTEREAREMTEEIRAAPLLSGARGREPVAVDAVVETIQRVGQLATDFPAIQELDVNPLVALPGGVSAVDLRLTVDPEKL